MKVDIQERHINAIKNILRGRISMTVSCLCKDECNYLVCAANAFLFDSDSLSDNEVIYEIMEYVLGTRSPKRKDRIKAYYDIIQQMHKDGEKLNIKPLRIIKKHNKQSTKVTTVDFDDTVESDIQKDLAATRRQKALQTSIEQLISEQKQASDEYYANYKPYKMVHERRYDFEVKNQLKSTEDYIAEVEAVYGDTLDCSSTRYVDHKTCVTVRCKKHDITFTRTPLNLLKGWGCPKCNKDQGKTWANTIQCTYNPERKSERWDTARFIRESVARFGIGVFDYTPCKYVNNDTKVTLIRMVDNQPINVYPYEHLRHDADYDGTQKYYEGKTNEEKTHFIVREIHSHLEQPVYVPYQQIDESKDQLRFVCPQHGLFQSSLARIRNGSCCPDCTKVGESIGERNVRRYLSQKGIDYVQEYYISNKKYFPTFVRIDFYLPQSNTFIEFQGEQHYGIDIQPNAKRNFTDQQLRDMKVRQYARDHNIQLIEIPYTYRNNVGDYLKRYTF